MSPRSAANKRSTRPSPAFFLVASALLLTVSSSPAFAQQGQGRDSRVHLDPRQAVNMRGPWVTQIAHVMNDRLEDWRRAWSHDNVKRLLGMYTVDAMLIPPGGAPPARGLQEIRTFFEKFLPTVGEVRTSLVDFDAGSALGYTRGRFVYTTGHQQDDRSLEVAASGTIFTVFRREGSKWKIRLQLFMVED